MIRRVLTTDDGSDDLDICHEKRRAVGIVVDRIGEVKPQAECGHERHTRSRLFISKKT